MASQFHECKGQRQPFITLSFTRVAFLKQISCDDLGLFACHVPAMQQLCGTLHLCDMEVSIVTA